MNSEKLSEILASHRLWVFSGETSGERADLRDANLRDVNLRDVNLRGANLQNTDLAGANLRDAFLLNANLEGANLQNASLQGVYLKSANLRGANLKSASLRGASLRWAELVGAILKNADLCSASLRDANFESANLGNASLRGADLGGANFRDADLRDANLRDANLDGTNLERAIFSENWQIVPPVGQSFTAFKKARGEIVLELLIPGSAQRTSSLIGRKCRANEALVVGVVRGVANDTGIYRSLHDPGFTYEIGKMASEPSFDPDIRVECTAGIHFFMTKEEAISYR